jgi:hypothetical protein
VGEALFAALDVVAVVDEGDAAAEEDVETPPDGVQRLHSDAVYYLHISTVSTRKM